MLLPVALGAAYLGGLPYLVVCLLAGLLAGFEFFRLTRQGSPSYMLGLAGIAALMLEAHFFPGRELEAVLVALAIIGLVWAVLRQDLGGWAAWGISFAGILYIGLLGRHLVLLRLLPAGLKWVALAALPTWACDTCAYLAGTTWGKHPLLARISPKKTWEGAIGGTMGGLASVLILGYLWNIPWAHAAILGIAISWAAILGDFAESLLKRQAGVKDSSSLIPGHGGLLDRIDSLLFTAPLVYYYLIMVLAIH